MNNQLQDEAARFLDGSLTGRIWRCYQADLSVDQIATVLDKKIATVRCYLCDLYDLMIAGKSRRANGNKVRRYLLSRPISAGLRKAVEAGMA